MRHSHAMTPESRFIDLPDCPRHLLAVGMGHLFYGGREFSPGTGQPAWPVAEGPCFHVRTTSRENTTGGDRLQIPCQRQNFHGDRISYEHKEDTWRT